MLYSGGAPKEKKGPKFLSVLEKKKLSRMAEEKKTGSGMGKWVGKELGGGGKDATFRGNASY